MSVSLLTGKPIEVAWFKSAEAMPLMRYEVLVFEKGIPFMGTIVTRLSLDAYLQEHGMIAGILHSKRPAWDGEETDLF